MIVKVIVRQLQGQFLGQIEEQMAEQREDQIILIKFCVDVSFEVATISISVWTLGQELQLLIGHKNR